jgi:hypothetical protein
MFRLFSSVTSRRRSTVRANSRHRARTRLFESLEERRLMAADMPEVPSFGPETQAHYAALGTRSTGQTPDSADEALEALMLLELNVEAPIPLLDQTPNGGAPGGLEEVACSNNLMPQRATGPHVIDPPKVEWPMPIAPQIELKAEADTSFIAPVHIDTTMQYSWSMVR